MMTLNLLLLYRLSGTTIPSLDIDIGSRIASSCTALLLMCLVVQLYNPFVFGGITSIL